MRSSALALGVLLAVTAPAKGQAPAELPKVTSSADVTLVNIDVVVTGKDGNPVHGLTAADFEVFHGKKPVTVTNFREERAEKKVETLSVPSPQSTAPAPTATVAPSVTAPPEAVEASRPPRHIVLFIDYLSLPDERERKEVFDSLKKLLRQSIGPDDAAMIVTWRRAITRVVPFTNNVGALERGLDAAAGAATRIPGEQSEIDRLAADDAFYAWVGYGDSELSRSMDAMQAYAELKGKVYAVKGLVGMMAGMEGRKAAILVSRRFARRAGAEFGSQVDAKALIDSIYETANAADVTIHTMNANAWDADLPTAASSRFLAPRINSPRGLTQSQSNWMNEMETLAVLAEKTGGVVVGSTGEAALFAERVSRDLGSWYSIGYPVPAGAKKSADISVEVKRPGVTVRTRRSVYEKAPEEQMKDRALANLFRKDANARLPIAVVLKPPEAVKKGRYRTPIEVRVPYSHLVLTPTPRGSKGAISVFVAAASKNGEFSDVTRKRQEFELPDRDASSTRPGYLSFEVDAETASPEARISIAVWDEIGREAGFRLIVPASR